MRDRLRHACTVVLATIAWLSASGAAIADADWRQSLDWRGQSASMATTADGGFRLRTPTGTREIPAQPMRTSTASPLFDGLFAMAQSDLDRARVDAITDGAFDHGRPVPCRCFETGEKWPYVWTRDLSYAADLALARIDPERVRNGLRFKSSGVRAAGAPQGSYVVQDTGSGGSWPVSTDRVAWFLAARHLLDDPRFADETWRTLVDTLAQDREYAFDPGPGLYRGETSFLDWREQSYPPWTAHDVRFIAQSYALSTNVLHYQALRLAEAMASRRGDAGAARYRGQADALRAAIEQRFWREDRGLYMSYIGSADNPAPFEAYDLLGIALAIDSGVADPRRARRALAAYPALDTGSPVIWPEQPGVAIYHNRAIWPFVTAYQLRAARRLDDPAHIDLAIRSLVRGAALAGSNMENFELTTQATHVDDGALSGPVVNSPRQLWSVAAYLQMVMEGVFGWQDDGVVAPKLPVDLVPMLFGDRDAIRLQVPGREIVLRRPRRLDGNLLVSGSQATREGVTTVELVPDKVRALALNEDAPLFAPPPPAAPRPERSGKGWRVPLADAQRLYVDGVRRQPDDGVATLPARAFRQCMSLTRVGADGIESLHGPTACVGPEWSVAGAWPRRWRAAAGGDVRAMLRYSNPHGPINTGVTAAVKRLVLDCGDGHPQSGPIVMPHSEGMQLSTAWTFHVVAGARCSFDLVDGFNMSYLGHFAHYTGGEGGATGPLDEADIGELLLAPAPAGGPAGEQREGERE